MLLDEDVLNNSHDSDMVYNVEMNKPDVDENILDDIITLFPTRD